VQASLSIAEIEIADQKLRIYKRPAIDLVKTERKRRMTDKSDSVCSVQSLCQTVTRTARKHHAGSLPLKRTGV